MKTGPRYEVCQVRFSTFFRPCAIAQAQGCLIERTLGPRRMVTRLHLYPDRWRCHSDRSDPNFLSDRARRPPGSTNRTAPAGRSKASAHQRAARPRRQLEFGRRRSPMSFQKVLLSRFGMMPFLRSNGQRSPAAAHSRISRRLVQRVLGRTCITAPRQTMVRQSRPPPAPRPGRAQQIAVLRTP